MIHYILKSFSYIFHPLFMPLLGVIFYFAKTPRFIPEPVMQAKVFSVTILTIILPILLYFLLKTIKRVDSMALETTRERIIPLVLNVMIVVLILKRVLPFEEIPELYYFYLGILFSVLTCLFLAILKFKASIHMIGSGGFFMFAVALSIHFKINIIHTIAFMCLAMGAIATSRLHLKAHTNAELIIGLLVGLVPQLVLLNYWL